MSIQLSFIFFPFPLAYNSVVLKRAQRVGFKEINTIHIHTNEFYLTSQKKQIENEQKKDSFRHFLPNVCTLYCCRPVGKIRVGSGRVTSIIVFLGTWKRRRATFFISQFAYRSFLYTIYPIYIFTVVVRYASPRWLYTQKLNHSLSKRDDKSVFPSRNGNYCRLLIFHSIWRMTIIYISSFQLNPISSRRFYDNFTK